MEKLYFKEEDVIAFGNFIRDNYHGVGAPRLISYNHIKYPHGTIEDIYKIWIKENPPQSKSKLKEANEFIVDIANLLEMETDGIGFDGLQFTIDDFEDAITSQITEGTLIKLLEFVDKKTNWKTCEDTTNSQVITEFLNNHPIQSEDDNITMLKDWFTFSENEGSEIGLAECPNCGEAVVYNDGCIKCSANFIFKEGKENIKTCFIDNKETRKEINEKWDKMSGSIGKMLEVKKEDDLSGVDCPNCKTSVDSCKCNE